MVEEEKSRQPSQELTLNRNLKGLQQELLKNKVGGATPRLPLEDRP